MLLAAGSLLLALPVAGALARVQSFAADWEASRWVVESAPRQCALTHDIPRFGRVRFEQQSGRRLTFSLQVDQPPVRDQQVHIRSEPLPWNSGQAVRDIGNFELRQGKQPLTLPRDQALRLYYELEQGMRPVLVFSDWGDGQDRVEVALTPVRFREALPRFLACTAGLFYLDFEPRDTRKVYFSTNSASLSRQTRRVLEQVAREYRRKRNFRIVLGGHADQRGESDYNLELSRRRALMVARYLRSRGVPAAAIESRFFGEQMPASEENGPKGWAKNRRVTVWIADP